MFDVCFNNRYLSGYHPLGVAVWMVCAFELFDGRACCMTHLQASFLVLYSGIGGFLAYFPQYIVAKNLIDGVRT